MYRYRKSLKQFSSEPKNRQCPFCHLEAERRVVGETPLVAVIANKYPYDIWEFRDVTDHLLVVPKRHVAGMAELTAEERMDIINFVAEYESADYEVYARSVANKTRSIAGHQHTHLIRTSPTQAKAALYIRKPYFLRKIS